jgi:modification methylase
MTETRSFGSGDRVSHDASAFYGRAIFDSFRLAQDDSLEAPAPPPQGILNRVYHGSCHDMHQLPDRCVALVVTSPPYNVGKTEYEEDLGLSAYLDGLRRAFQECWRVLEPGGRLCLNVANLGRKPYIPMTALVTGVCLEIGYVMRGQVIWQKQRGAAGSCAWGTYCSAKNPVLRDVHEYLLIFSKGSLSRAYEGESTIQKQQFQDWTLSVWQVPPARASKIGHPAPFPVELPRRLIELYTYKGDLVLDPFMGSGSTAVAAVQAGRSFLGYDTYRPYVDLTYTRLRSEAGWTPVAAPRKTKTTSSSNGDVPRPPVHWPGGKGQLLDACAAHFPPLDQIPCYFEPFLGGGAVFFYLVRAAAHPVSAVLNDLSRPLVTLYEALRDHVEELVEVLGQHQETLEAGSAEERKDYYYTTRSAFNERLGECSVSQAARMYFLNRCAFNGLWRVNSKGEFNAPIGTNRPLSVDESNLRACSRALQKAVLIRGDFEAALHGVFPGAFVYFDPPYLPLSETSSFTAFTREGFPEEEHVRLAEVFRDCVRRGAYCLLSNSYCDRTLELYSDFEIVTVQARRSINSKGRRRGSIPEALVIGRP